MQPTRSSKPSWPIFRHAARTALSPPYGGPRGRRGVRIVLYDGLVLTDGRGNLEVTPAAYYRLVLPGRELTRLVMRYTWPNGLRSMKALDALSAFSREANP